MHVARWAAAAIFCGVAAAPAAFGQQKAGTGDSGWTAVTTQSTAKVASGKPAFAWPPLPEKQPQPANAVKTWTNQEIEHARARCTVLLKDLDVVVVPEAPVRDGAECGTPAPMQLVSLGSSPQVSFSPPPTLTCDMIAALHKWMHTGMQPAARKYLGGPVVRVATMSSYSCRNAYGRAKGRLSEHGRMNAIDIGAFISASGKTAMVLADWGPNAREIAAKAAAEAARKLAEAEAAKKAGDQKVATTPTATTTVPVPAPAPLRPSIAATIPGITLQMPTAPPAALSMSEQARLGGPKAPSVVAPPAPALSTTAQFLRAAHTSACSIFGTVLGPEANAAHNNHFHLDMAERKVRVICE